MNMSKRRIGAIYRKDMREFRRNKQVLATLCIVPLIFTLPPVVDILAIPSQLSLHGIGHVLLYMLAIPALLPAQIAAFTVVGERLQGTLEPVLGTPIRREEFLLGKAQALLLPSIATSYGVYAIVIAIIELFAHPGVASAFVTPQGIAAQAVFSPLVAVWSIWAGLAISSRCADSRVAQQLSFLVTLPVVAVTALMAYGVLPASLTVALVSVPVLVILDLLAWRVALVAFDRERLITARGISRTRQRAAIPAGS